MSIGEPVRNLANVHRVPDSPRERWPAGPPQDLCGDLVRGPVVGVHSQITDPVQVVDDARRSIRDLAQPRLRLPDQLVAGQAPRRCEASAAARDPVGHYLPAGVQLAQGDRGGGQRGGVCRQVLRPVERADRDQ